MANLDNARNYLSNVSRNVWLALGLVVIAVLLAVSFMYGETDDLANRNDGGEQAGEQAAAGSNDEEQATGEESEQDGEEAAGSEEAANTGDPADGEQTVANTGADDEALPTELADTGPAIPALAIGALTAFGYMHRRSSSELKNKRSQ